MTPFREKVRRCCRTARDISEKEAKGIGVLFFPFVFFVYGAYLSRKHKMSVTAVLFGLVAAGTGAFLVSSLHQRLLLFGGPTVVEQILLGVIGGIAAVEVIFAVSTITSILWKKYVRRSSGEDYS